MLHHLQIVGRAGEQERRRSHRVLVSARDTGLRLGHARVRICAVREQSVHQLQLGLAIRNTAHRVDQTVHAVCREAFPFRRRPMQRRKAGIADVGVGSVIEQEERQRDLAPYRGHEQRSVAIDVPAVLRPPICRPRRCARGRRLGASLRPFARSSACDRIFTFTPAASSNWTISWSPSRAAKCIAVNPALLWALRSACASMSACATSSVMLRRGPHQRRLVLRRLLRLDRGAELEQPLNGVHAAALRASHERGHAGGDRRVRIGARFQE